MFDRFTQSAQSVVVGAQEQARRLRHPYIGTEHLLLALLEPAAGVAAGVLRDAGVDAERVQQEVQRRVGSVPPALTDDDAAALRTIGIDLDEVLARLEQTLGPDPLTPIGSDPPRRAWWRRRRPGSARSLRFGPRSKKVVELALRESLALRHKHIGAEHILLALLREGDGLAAQILTDLGLDLRRLRRATLAALASAA